MIFIVRIRQTTTSDPYFHKPTVFFATVSVLACAHKCPAKTGVCVTSLESPSNLIRFFSMVSIFDILIL